MNILQTNRNMILPTHSTCWARTDHVFDLLHGLGDPPLHVCQWRSLIKLKHFWIIKNNKQQQKIANYMSKFPRFSGYSFDGLCNSSRVLAWQVCNPCKVLSILDLIHSTFAKDLGKPMPSMTWTWDISTHPSIGSKSGGKQPRPVCLAERCQWLVVTFVNVLLFHSSLMNQKSMQHLQTYQQWPMDGYIVRRSLYLPVDGLTREKFRLSAAALSIFCHFFFHPAEKHRSLFGKCSEPSRPAWSRMFPFRKTYYGVELS